LEYKSTLFPSPTSEELREHRKKWFIEFKDENLPMDVEKILAQTHKHYEEHKNHS